MADVAWSMNAPEYWLLLVGERGWLPQRFGEWLGDAWRRLFLDAPPERDATEAGAAARGAAGP